jgi:hypothetical protein
MGQDIAGTHNAGNGSFRRRLGAVVMGDGVLLPRPTGELSGVSLTEGAWQFGAQSARCGNARHLPRLAGKERQLP